MPLLRLPTSLLDLLPPAERAAATAHAVPLLATSWPLATEEIRSRFPELAERVLGPNCSVQRGFILALNDEVVPRDMIPQRLGSADEVCILPQLAGG